MTNKRIRIAIDGPSGAGKSTVAKKVAKKLALLYIDTGAMYRALTWKLLRLDKLKAEAEWSSLLATTSIDLSLDGTVTVDGNDVTSSVRAPEVSHHVPQVAASPEVRLKMVQMQREMITQGGIVMDGRDIGTVVIPDAEVKVFLTASLPARAERRYAELKKQGYQVTLNEIIEALRERDLQDINRPHAPLKPAEDAHIVDTSHMSIDEVVTTIIRLIEERRGGA